MKKAFILLSLALAAGLSHAQVPSGYSAIDQHEGEKPAPAEAAAPVVYDVVRGASLRATLDRWAQMSGWQEPDWRIPADMDFTLGAKAEFKGDFVPATRAFIAALGPEADLKVTFNKQNRLVLVELAK